MSYLISGATDFSWAKMINQAGTTLNSIKISSSVTDPYIAFMAFDNTNYKVIVGSVSLSTDALNI
jgi:hypothetical protein